MSPKLTDKHLCRMAIVYVRQSTQGQVMSNKESQARQYSLRQTAEQMGFSQVEIIDEDLGRSGSGTVDRPGFKRLVGSVCANEVGAVFCVEGSRLARNGRDWHLLMEMCALTGTLLIDAEGTYDPASSNDRLLLGIKGTMNEFELHLIRERAQQGALNKARRGELKIALPVGYCWDQGQIIMDPDRRVQEALRLVFDKFQELRSARQVWLWLEQEQLRVPVRYPAYSTRPISWGAPSYARILAILTHPAYAGAYAFGRTQSQTRIVEGLPCKTQGHLRPQELWLALIQQHHPGYITWEQHQRNLALLSENAHMKKDGDRKAGRGGRALLSGLLRCQRCGHMLRVRYSGTDGLQHRYSCRMQQQDPAHRGSESVFCVTASGHRIDSAVAHELLRVVEPRAIHAALHVMQQGHKEREQVRKARELELEQARYEASVASRRYDQVDLANRLVAAELEARWNAALRRVTELERALQQAALSPSPQVPDQKQLLALAADLPRVWSAPTADAALKQRIVSILVREVIIGVDEATHEVVLTIHWVGEQHSQLRLQRRRADRKARTQMEASQVLRAMAQRWSDREIALTLNRLLLKTPSGQRWTQVGVHSLRQQLGLPAYEPSLVAGMVNLATAAARLGVTQHAVQRLLAQGLLRGTQPLPWGPWLIPSEELDNFGVRRATQRPEPPGSPPSQQHQPPLPGLGSDTPA